MVFYQFPKTKYHVENLDGDSDSTMEGDEAFQPSSRQIPQSDHESRLLDNGIGSGTCYGTQIKPSFLQDLPTLEGSVKPQRKTWSRKSRCVALGGALLTIVVLSHLYTALFPIVCRLGSTSKKAGLPSPSDTNTNFGIGFQLTPAYGVSAIRHANGTISNVARMDFTTESVDHQPETFYHMIQRLAESKNYRDPWAGYCHDDNIGVGPPLTRRYLRKLARRLAGLPSTEDVGRLADAIRALKGITEDALGHPVKEVIVTAPMLNQLCRKDIREAAEYAGLTPLMDTFPYHSHDVSAAYAGYGQGLCETYGNRTRCGEEEGELPTKNTLSVLYTKHVLMVSLHSMKTAERIYEPLYFDYVVEWQGFLTQDSQRNADAFEAQWQSIALRLAQLPINAYPPIPKIDRIMIMGESGAGKVMARAVNRAMEILYKGEVGYEVFMRDTEYVAARGAAELAWRKQHGR